MFRAAKRVLQLGDVPGPVSTRRGGPHDISLLRKDEVWKMRPNLLRWNRKQTRNGMHGKYNKVKISAFRPSQRVLQLGDFQRELQPTGPGGTDDLCALWKNAVRKMCGGNLRQTGKRPSNRLFRGHNQVFLADSDLRREYCNWETFSATCERNQVVLMTSAHYGRMRLGRCVQKTYDDQGNQHRLGCAEDIIRYFLY